MCTLLHVVFLYLLHISAKKSVSKLKKKSVQVLPLQGLGGYFQKSHKQFHDFYVGAGDVQGQTRAWTGGWASRDQHGPSFFIYSCTVHRQSGHNRLAGRARLLGFFFV